MPEKLCVVTPALPPSIDGLGDYCRQLWCNWPAAGNADTRQLDWQFLVTAGVEESSKVWSEAKICQFERSTAGLMRALDEKSAEIVLLQYVGYGYETNGQPFWLVEAIGNWLAAKPGRRLIVMFHETWASGMPWQRAFWQRDGQRRCASELFSLASPPVTSNLATFRDLQSLGIPKELNMIPLGTSFSIHRKESKNWRQLLVFGKEASRVRALKLHSKLLRQSASAGLIERVVLAGQSSAPEADPSKLLVESWNLPIELAEDFNFPSDDVPTRIISSGLSLMHTQSTCLLKSTSFQLAAQLGQVPIVIQELDPEDSVICGKHYLGYQRGCSNALVDQLANQARLEEISASLAELGAGRLSWPAIARAWSDLIAGQS